MQSHTKNGSRFWSTAAVLIGALAIFAKSAAAATYDESISGDLPNNPASPHALTLSLGTNSILGTVGSGGGVDSLDAIALTVPAGLVLSGFTNAVYADATTQDFVGFQAGSSFVGSIFTNSNYAGLAHFGLTASNAGVGTPPGSPTSTVGLDLLPIMNNEGVAVGATGFTLPLGPGTYTFIIGTLTPSLSEFPTYQFDATVTPEPTGLLFLGITTILLMLPQRRIARR